MCLCSFIQSIIDLLWTDNTHCCLTFARLDNQLICTHYRTYASANWVNIGSANGLSPARCWAITWTNADLLSNGPSGTNFSEIWIATLTFSFRKMRLKMSSAKCRPSCLDISVVYWFITKLRNSTVLIKYLSIQYLDSAGYILGYIRYSYTLLSFLGIEITLVGEIIFLKNRNLFLAQSIQLQLKITQEARSSIAIALNCGSWWNMVSFTNIVNLRWGLK